MKAIKKQKSRYSLSLVASVVLHVVAFAYIYKKANPELDKLVVHHSPAQKSISIKLDSVKFISKKEVAQIKEAKLKQIVANELNGHKERPAESRFSGEADQTFDRQTIAATNGSFKKAGLGTKSGNVSAQEEKAAVEQALKVAQSKPKSPAVKKEINLSDLGSFNMQKVEEEDAKIQEEMARKIASAAKKSGALGIEKGSGDTVGLAQNNDFIEDVPLGDMTNLNTTEFKYYGFYHRIRQKLEQYWGSSIQNKAKSIYKSGRRLPASENLITAVQVTLDDRGQIVEIKIEGTSGIRELDQAAVESFNKAGPFPNPPKGLLVGGRATIQWGFVVKS